MQLPITIHSVPTVYECERSWCWRPAVLTDYDCWGVLGGKGTLQINDQCHEVGADCLALLRPGDRVIGNHDPEHPLRVIAFHFLPDREWMKNVDSGKSFRRLAPSGQMEFFARQAASPRAGGSGSVDRWRTHLAAVEILLLFFDPTEGQEDSVKTRIDLVASRVQSAPHQVESISKLAEAAGMSSAHFSREFRKRIGCSPVEFWIQARVDRAVHLLTETELSVGTIADSLGYADIFTFSKQFKKIQGCSPASYRSGRRT